ncbi:MAG: HAD hydrolase-like protein [Solirubrobacteraceae bacterium]
MSTPQRSPATRSLTPKRFGLALRANDHPGEVWMVGANPNAEVAGAEAAEIRSILVRTDFSQAPRRAHGLHEAAAIIDQ